MLVYIILQDNVEEDTLSDVNELYCIACDKLFASVKAKINHEASKRHKKQSDLLRKILLEEEQNAKNESELVEKSSDIDQPFETQGNLDEPEGSPLREAAPEVKLSKRAKKAQRKRRKEEEKLVASTANLSLDDPVSPLGESTEVVDSTTLESSSGEQWIYYTMWVFNTECFAKLQFCFTMNKFQRIIGFLRWFRRG